MTVAWWTCGACPVAPPRLCMRRGPSDRSHAGIPPARRPARHVTNVVVAMRLTALRSRGRCFPAGPVAFARSRTSSVGRGGRLLVRPRMPRANTLERERICWQIELPLGILERARAARITARSGSVPQWPSSSFATAVCSAATDGAHYPPRVRPGECCPGSGTYAAINRTTRQHAPGHGLARTAG